MNAFDVEKEGFISKRNTYVVIIDVTIYIVNVNL